MNLALLQLKKELNEKKSTTADFEKNADHAAGANERVIKIQEIIFNLIINIKLLLIYNINIKNEKKTNY